MPDDHAAPSFSLDIEEMEDRAVPESIHDLMVAATIWDEMT